MCRASLARSTIEYIRAGTLRALAVTTETRLKILPEIPTIGECVPGYEGSGRYGVGAPRNTPAEVIEKLNSEINACLADPKMQTRLAELGVEPTPTKPAEFGKLIAGETEKWAKVIRAANIKVEERHCAAPGLVANAPRGSSADRECNGEAHGNR